MAEGATALEHGVVVLEQYLGWLRARGDGLTDAEIHAVLGPDAVPSLIRGFLRDREHLASCQLVTDPEEDAPGRIAAYAVDERGVRYRFVVVTRADGNAHVMLLRALPDGFMLRDAVSADGPALAEVCRSTPIVTGEVSSTVDYGVDYLQATALVPGREVVVVEHDGRIVAMHSCVLHDAVINGAIEQLAYLRHTRIDPALQGLGIFSALNGALFERGYPTGATPYSLVALGNERMLDKLPAELSGWPWLHTRFHLDTAATADASAALVEVDAADAMLLINEAHHGEAIRAPASQSSLTARLELAPHLYDADRLLGGNGAVIGVGRLPVTVVTETPDAREEVREVVAYDVGFADTDALEAVLRAWCARLAAEGIDTLAIDASTASPLHGLLAPLAASARTFALQISIPPPPAARGFGVDPAFI